MYNDQIENLINLALADGELTDKEKIVLFKKAEAAGIDIDEFEIVLEAKLHSRQKEGASTATRDNVIKCPSCNDIILALSRVCPSCSFVLDAGKKSSESQKGLEDLIKDIEDNLVQIKSMPQPNIFQSLQERAYISLPLLTIILCVIGFRLEIFAIAILGLILVYFSFKIVRKKLNEKKTDTTNRNQAFEAFKANFQKHSRTAKTLFGENKRVKLLLEELQNELNSVEGKRTKGKKFEMIGYTIIIIATIIAFLVPAKSYKSYAEEKNEAKQEALSKIKTKSFVLNGRTYSTLGNIGRCYQVTSKQVELKIDYFENNFLYSEDRRYAVSSSAVNLSMKPSEKQRLKDEVIKLIRNCNSNPQTLELCASIHAALILEDENKNSISGVSKIEVVNERELQSFLQSNSEDLSLEFSSSGFMIDDIEKLTKAKNFTISITASKK